MSLWRLILSSIRYHWRTELGVLAGSAVATAVLVGSLVVGDSVRHSLKRISLDRLGKTEFSMVTGDRFFRDALSDEISSTDIAAAPGLQVRGIAVAHGGKVRVNTVRVTGVDRRFWQFAPSPAAFELIKQDEALLNLPLANRLGVTVGDTVLLRIENSSSTSVDIPFVSEDDTSIALRLKIKALLTPEQYGNFSLAISQAAPFNVFVSLSALAEKMKLAGKANLLVCAGAAGRNLREAELTARLRNKWQITDAGLHISPLPDGRTLELASDRIFISPVVTEASLAIGEDPQGIFGYFVNSLSINDKTTPYSFVAAPGYPMVPKEMRDNEIVINRWLADDLGAKAGETIDLTYFVIGPLRRLREQTSTFTIRSIIAPADTNALRRLMPAFPGLSDAENCRDWDKSLPIDLKRIRKKDEKYWEEYRGTPKAFVTLPAAQKMWSNRFGNLTAVRYPDKSNSANILANCLQDEIDPARLGLSFVPIRSMALNAGNESVDFAQLFIGLSFFLIIAALLLTGILFVFSIENRRSQTALLKATGFTNRAVTGLYLAEGSLISIAGSAVGTILGIIYNRVVLLALNTIWQGAVGTAELEPFLLPQTLLIGFFSGMVVSLVCIWLVLRRQTGCTVQELHAGGSGYSPVTPGRSRTSLSVAILAGVAAVAIIFLVPLQGGAGTAAAFFGAGSLLLVSLLSASSSLLTTLGTGPSKGMQSISSLMLRNCARRRGRSLTVVALIAAGTFLVIAVAANRKSPDTTSRSSGTGGFALYGETALPLSTDLNTAEGRKSFNLEEIDTVTFVQMRAKEGDNASCLNLNRVTNPRILGVDPREFSRRKAFSFANLADNLNHSDPWMTTLGGASEKDVIPAVADQGVITWALGKKIGDTLTIADDRGNRAKLRLVGGLANSVFQGSVLISEEHFLRLFPSSSGSRVILVDAPEKSRASLAADLTSRMEDIGLELLPAADRLQAFSVVENTYLTIFLALGGLGVILGTVGLGVVVMRNVLERRRELALMQATGFSRSEIFQMILGEHSLLLFTGLVAGGLAGIIAVIPAILAAGAGIPALLLAIILIIITINGIIWIAIAASAASRGDQLAALQME